MASSMTAPQPIVRRFCQRRRGRPRAWRLMSRTRLLDLPEVVHIETYISLVVSNNILTMTLSVMTNIGTIYLFFLNLDRTTRMPATQRMARGIELSRISRLADL